MNIQLAEFGIFGSSIIHHIYFSQTRFLFSSEHITSPTIVRPESHCGHKAAAVSRNKGIGSLVVAPDSNDFHSNEQVGWARCATPPKPN
jgi:hypothetical protein